MGDKSLGQIAHEAKLAIDPNAWMTPAWDDLAPIRRKLEEAGAQAVAQEACERIAAKLLERVNEFDKLRESLGVDDTQGFGTCNGAIMGLELAILDLTPTLPASPSEAEPDHPATEDSGIAIDILGGNCPVQAEGCIDGEPFYFRARGQSWSLGIGGDPVSAPKWEHCEEWGESPLAAGWMEEAEARRMIAKGAALYRKPVAP